MTDEFDLLAGVDEPRPLPAELRRPLERTLTGEEPAIIALGGADRPRALPAEMAERVAERLAGDAGAAVPAPVRRRIERRLIGRPALSRAAALAAALLFMISAAAVVGRDRGSDDVVSTGTDGGRQATTAAPPAVGPAGERVSGVAAEGAAAPPDDVTFGAAGAQVGPNLVVGPVDLRRGDSAAVRAQMFSTSTVHYSLRAPSGRVVLEGDAPLEFRVTVPRGSEIGRYVLVVEDAARTQFARSELNVVA